MVLATLVFNLVSIAACAFEIVLGRAQPVVFLILVTSVLIVGITGRLLGSHGVDQATRDVASWLVALLVAATAAATLFGLLPQFVGFFAGTFGYKGTDEFLYRQAGAATLGYAAMGVGELRSLTWDQLRLPTIMALTFNALSAIASFIEVVAGTTTPLVLLISLASTVFTIAFVMTLARRGR